MRSLLAASEAQSADTSLLSHSANKNVNQVVEVCSDFEKRGKLVKHLEKISQESAKVLIFIGTKRVADDLTKVSSRRPTAVSARTEQLSTPNSICVKTAGPLSLSTVTSSSRSAIGSSESSSLAGELRAAVSSRWNY